MDVFLDAGAIIDLFLSDGFSTLDPNVTYITSDVITNRELRPDILEAFNNWAESADNFQKISVGIDLTIDSPLTRSLGVAFDADGNAVGQFGDASFVGWKANST